MIKPTIRLKIIITERSLYLIKEMSAIAKPPRPTNDKTGVRSGRRMICPNDVILMAISTTKAKVRTVAPFAEFGSG